MKTLITILLIAASYKPIVLDKSYQHDKWGIQPTDIIKQFRAYTVSFDSNDDDISTGIPEWVAYQIKPSKKLPAAPKRPSKWIAETYSPTDDSYKNSGMNRGHLCPGVTSWRLGNNASWNSHSIINATPQLPSFNQGIWRDLEKKCESWADESGKSVWVITGPVLYNHFSIEWIGDEGEVPVAIPQAFYKIIVREPLEVLALLYPHTDYARKGPYHHSKFIVSVDYIEMLTKLDFFTNLSDEIEKKIESRVAPIVWGASRIRYKK